MRETHDGTGPAAVDHGPGRSSGIVRVEPRQNDVLAQQIDGWTPREIGDLARGMHCDDGCRVGVFLDVQSQPRALDVGAQHGRVDERPLDPGLTAHDRYSAEGNHDHNRRSQLQVRGTAEDLLKNKAQEDNQRRHALRNETVCRIDQVFGVIASHPDRVGNLNEEESQQEQGFACAQLPVDEDTQQCEEQRHEEVARGILIERQEARTDPLPGCDPANFEVIGVVEKIAVIVFLKQQERHKNEQRK